MQEAEHGVTDMAMNQGRFHGDENLLVKFFTHPRHNKAKSLEEGRPIFEEQPYIQIMQPGNKDSIVVRPATKMDKQRFPEHFRKYEAREDQEKMEGTPLTEWPGITRSQCEELKYLNIQTVEQLANVSDTNAQGMMGVALLKSKAGKYLEKAKETATADALNAANARIDELVALVEAKTAEEPKKRGRPKKEAAEE